MGIIKAAADLVKGNLGDQWLEVYEAENMGDQTVFTRGVQIRRGQNTKGTDNTVSNGSVVHVYDNQFMILVDGGKIVDYTAEPGYYTINNSALPSMLNGQFGDSLSEAFKRFKYGGQICYNGTDIDEINTESLYQNVTMVSQSTYLFDTTIAENLRIAKPDATDDELMAALRMASAEELVQALPEGLNTPAGLLGGRLSMGERQRIGLARAFLSGCPLILLDEPTSNVDSINEGVILRALLKHRQDRTIILVSHRASTMAVADRGYKMENGQMEEQAI